VTLPRALITGVNGQDGYYLAKLLVDKGYEVVGLTRQKGQDPFDPHIRLESLHGIDLSEPHLLGELISAVEPDEVYHLAAHHFSSSREERHEQSLVPFLRVNLEAVDSALRAIRKNLPKCKFMYASSSHVFGHPTICPQTEETRHSPLSPYAVTKSAGAHLCEYYRQVHGVFSAVAILYNHESSRRGGSFITTQIARTAALAARGEDVNLSVRNLDAITDWGAAVDYVRAMWLMLQQPQADTYIVASGVGRTVRELARQAFDSVGLGYEDYISQPGGPITGHRRLLVGDASKLKTRTSWRPQITFKAMISQMVRSNIDLMS
jgi:GDPmannose 4,6-dehydratase